MIVAKPKDIWRTAKTSQFDGILDTLKKEPQIISEDEPRTFPSRPPLMGIQPPDVTIILTNEEVKLGQK